MVPVVTYDIIRYGCRIALDWTEKSPGESGLRGPDFGPANRGQRRLLGRVNVKDRVQTRHLQQSRNPCLDTEQPDSSTRSANRMVRPDETADVRRVHVGAMPKIDENVKAPQLHQRVDTVPEWALVGRHQVALNRKNRDAVDLPFFDNTKTRSQ